MKNWFLSLAAVILTLAAVEGVFYVANRTELRDRIGSRDSGRVASEAPGSPGLFEIPESMTSLPVVRNVPVPYDSRLDQVVPAQKIADGFYDFEYREKIGFMAAAPRRTSRAQMRLHSGETVYDVTYEIDVHRRRVVPGEASKPAKRHAIFLGCSMTFGEGVAGHEMYTAHFGRLASDERVYNMGSIGYGLGDLLLRSRSDPAYWEGISERGGFAAYTFIDDHINRVFGAMSVTGVWGPRKPFFEDDGKGGIVHRGRYRDVRPIRTWFYGWLMMSQLVQFFKLDIPLYYTQEDFAFFARLVNELKREYVSRFESDRFYVVLMSPRRSYTSRLIPELDKLGIHYVDYSKANLGRLGPGPMLIPYDGHWSAQTHALLGERLYHDLAAYHRGGAKVGLKER